MGTTLFIQRVSLSWPRFAPRISRTSPRWTFSTKWLSSARNSSVFVSRRLPVVPRARSPAFLQEQEVPAPGPSPQEDSCPSPQNDEARALSEDGAPAQEGRALRCPPLRSQGISNLHSV